MKKIIAIAAIIASAQATAFWSDNTDMTNAYTTKGAADMYGDASGTATFGMNFTVTGDVDGEVGADGKMRGKHDTASYGNPYYYVPAQ